MCSHPAEGVLLQQNVFSYNRMCSEPIQYRRRGLVGTKSSSSRTHSVVFRKYLREHILHCTFYIVPETGVGGHKVKQLGGAELERERHYHVVVDRDRRRQQHLACMCVCVCVCVCQCVLFVCLHLASLSLSRSLAFIFSLSISVCMCVCAGLDSGFGVQGLGIQGSGIQGFGFRVQGVGAPSTEAGS